MSSRSDLECVVLGIVWKQGPITPYAIRQEFLTSPTPHFSGSAGAIYPLVSRLEAQGLLASEPTTQGRRRATQYRITRSGAAELRAWLRPPVPHADAASTFDPLRTRLYFLSALSMNQRRAYLDAALSALKAQLPIATKDEARYEASGDVFSHLGSQGIRRNIEERIDWLTNVRRALIARGLV